MTLAANLDEGTKFRAALNCSSTIQDRVFGELQTDGQFWVLLVAV